MSRPGIEPGPPKSQASTQARVADPLRFNADPDPAFLLIADPDPVLDRGF
jgi:hypothetical protein